MMSENNPTPGPIILLGSGETQPASGPAYDFAAKYLDQPLSISVLETPAGFQNNSEFVARNVADFIEKRLSNFDPLIGLIPARAKDTPFSPDDPHILSPMKTSNWVFMGPGSPTYTVRQLESSKALEYLYAIHMLGGALTFSSAAVLSMSYKTLPVYEIYKVGEDLHWVDGLNYLGKFGLDCVFIPHWNNNDGGDIYDSSRCYMGQDRFTELEKMLPDNLSLIGIDENTSLAFTFDDECVFHVFGKGRVTIRSGGKESVFQKGVYPLAGAGLSISAPTAQDVIEKETYLQFTQARKAAVEQPSEEVQMLASQRKEARENKDWALSDQLRDQINALGWDISDTPKEQKLSKK